MKSLFTAMLKICFCLSFLCVFSYGDDKQKSADKKEKTRKNQVAAEEKLPEEIVIGKRWRPLLDTPQLESPGLDTSISIIDETAIKEQNAYSLIDAMKYIPGAWTETRGRKVKQFFSVRGQRYPYPQFSINGVWQREFAELSFYFNARNFEKIEVLRSGSALLTGPGGTVGMINLVPKTYDKPETSIYTSFGSYNTTKVHINHGNTYNGISYSLGVGNYSTSGLHNMHASENMTDFYGHVSGSPTDELSLSLDLFGLYGKRDIKLAEYPVTNPKFTKDLSSYDPFRSLLTVGKAKYKPNNWASSELTVNYSLRDHNFVYIVDSTQEKTTYNEEDYEFGTSYIQTLKPVEDNTIRFGGFYNRWVAPNGKRFYWGNRSDVETISGVIVDEHHFGNLEVNAGYRLSRSYLNDYGWFNINGSPRGWAPKTSKLSGLLKSGALSPVKNEWESPTHNASAGAAYYLTENVSLHSNLAIGDIKARSGTLDENYNRPNNEIRYQADFGIKTTKKGLGEIDLTGFYVYQKDAIALTGNTDTINGREFELYTNRDQKQYGIEVDLRTERFEQGFQFFVNTVAMNSRKESNITNHMEDNDEIPKVISGAGVNFKKYSLDGSFFLKYISDYKNNRFLGSKATPEELGDFITLDANIGYTLDKKEQYRIFIAGENLTNVKYSTVPGYPELGARVYAGLELTF